MQFKYHHLITEQVLKNHFSARALKVIVRANFLQDNLIGNIRHPEHHFTENMIDASLDYIETQRVLVASILINGANLSKAWRAFGRLLHCAQDFYSHSNYVHLWVARFSDNVPPPDQVEALEQSLMSSSKLHTVRTYRPLGSLGNVPIFGRWLFPYLPADAHAKMNLDTDSRGPLFAYALAAAKKRTLYEFKETVILINSSGKSNLLGLFTDNIGPIESK